MTQKEVNYEGIYHQTLSVIPSEYSDVRLLTNLYLNLLYNSPIIMITMMIQKL